MSVKDGRAQSQQVSWLKGRVRASSLFGGQAKFRGIALTTEYVLLTHYCVHAPCAGVLSCVAKCTGRGVVKRLHSTPYGVYLTNSAPATHTGCPEIL